MAIDAAEAIIAAQGHEGLSTRKVAKQIGYTVGTLYLVFKNLDALVYEINARTLDLMYQYAAKLVQDTGDPLQNIHLLGQGYLDFAMSHLNRWRLFFDQMRRPADLKHVEDYRIQTYALFSLIEKNLRALAIDAEEQEVKKAARVIWSSVHGVCTLAFTGRLQSGVLETEREFIRSLITNFLNGWIKEHGQPGESDRP